MQKLVAILGLFILLASCGIRGEPVAPSQEEKKEKLDLSTVQQSGNKLTDVDPMVAEGAGNVKVVPLQSLNRLGKNYDASFGNNNQRLRDAIEQVKPASAYPKVRAPQPF